MNFLITWVNCNLYVKKQVHNATNNDSLQLVNARLSPNPKEAIYKTVNLL